jgi:hypothetical protein
MPEFIAGLELNRLFFEEAVRPILARRFPGLRYSAARIGRGSDVLGYDSARSTDHDWGPQLSLFLSESDYRNKATIESVLATNLPVTFRGWPTSFGEPDEKGVRVLEAGERNRVSHRVEIHTVGQSLRNTLGVDQVANLRPVDWLLMPQQLLLEVTGGEVYFDGLGELSAVRAQLAYYPDQIWLYLLSSQWTRIAQEEPFVGRCGEAGDDLGSRLIAARLVRDLIQLCFLMERRYAPYIKWLGTAFFRLSCAQELIPIFDAALQARSWSEREGHLCSAYEIVARMHNAIGITKALDPTTRHFHDRPYRVIDAERFANEIAARITDPELKRIRDKAGLIGGVDQFTDSTDLLGRNDVRLRLEALFTQ